MLLGGVSAIAWIYWYFFVAPARAAVRVSSAGGRSEIVVTVHGGYEPSTIHVEAGKPMRLIFDRQETNSCSEEIVIPDFGIRTFLPAFKRTTVEIAASAPGRYPFTCGMSMLHGTIIVD